MTRHGTGSAYNGGCRCDVCRLAHNARVRKWRNRSSKDFIGGKSQPDRDNLFSFDPATTAENED